MGIKITELLPIDQASVTDEDVLPIVDLESQATKKITVRKLREGLVAIDNGPNDPQDIESQHGVLLELSPTTGGLSADFNLAKLRTRFGAIGNLVYDPFTGYFTYHTPNSDGITEGTTNKYYTDARARASISVSGTNISYDPNTGVITFGVGDPGGVAHVAGLTITDQAIMGETPNADISINPDGGYVHLLGDLKFNDSTIQTTAFPGYGGWSSTTDNIAFTTSGIGKKVSLNYGSNSIFVDTTGVSLRGGSSTLKVNTSGQLVFPDSTTQTTAFNITSMPNSSVIFKSGNTLANSTKFTYLNDELNVDTINTKDINFVGSGTVDISSQSNLQISALGTISINGVYTIPTTIGSAKKVLTTNGTNAATWEYTGADHEFTGPNSTIWSTRTYNGGINLSYVDDTSDSVSVTHTENSSPGSEIFVSINATPHVQQVPVGAIVNGSGLTNANVITSEVYSGDNTKWRIVVDQTGSFTTSSTFNITWGSSGTGPLVWWDADQGPLGATSNFRGAIVEYQALVRGIGVIVGTCTISNLQGDNVVVHTESTSGNNQITNYSFWDINNEKQLQIGRAHV